MRYAAGILTALLAVPGWLHAAEGSDAVLATLGAAEKGNQAAQYEIAMMYDLGRGVGQDLAEAVKWYRRAAEQGYPRAQFALAEMYKNGDGVEKNLDEAVRWYRLAAEGGSADAQLLLGVLYESGLGVPEDFREAAKWYRLSADQGDPRAQLLLGVLYHLGQGVPKDAVVAYALYSASARGDPSPGNPATGHRTQLARSMSSAEIQAADNLFGAMSQPGAFSSSLDRQLKGLGGS
jgi:uncharacterized protein